MHEWSPLNLIPLITLSNEDEELSIFIQKKQKANEFNLITFENYTNSRVYKEYQNILQVYPILIIL
jgi:hypothetical protein